MFDHLACEHTNAKWCVLVAHIPVTAAYLSSWKPLTFACASFEKQMLVSVQGTSRGRVEHGRFHNATGSKAQRLALLKRMLFVSFRYLSLMRGSGARRRHAELTMPSFFVPLKKLKVLGHSARSNAETHWFDIFLSLSAKLAGSFTRVGTGWSNRTCVCNGQG